MKVGSLSRVDQANEAKHEIKEWRRATHQQILDESSATPIQTFEGCQFIANLKGRDVKFNQYGGMDITFTIQPEMVDYALPLRHAFRRGVVLSLDVQPWRPYTEAVSELDDE